jgi:hypothetical protein
MCPVLDSSSFVPLPMLKRQSPLLSYVRERDREKVHCKCTIQFTVHFIIALFNVGNVLLCVIYLPYLCMLQEYHVIQYIAFGIIRGRS